MRCLLVVLLVMVTVVSSAKDRYSQFDHIDVDAILKSQRLLRNYYNCIMGNGPCTRDGVEFKKVIPEALQTECAKCSEIQKKQVGKIMAYVQLHHPDMWEAVLNKYDTEGTFRKKYGYNEDDEDSEDKK